MSWWTAACLTGSLSRVVSRRAPYSAHFCLCCTSTTCLQPSSVLSSSSPTTPSFISLSDSPQTPRHCRGTWTWWSPSPTTGVSRSRRPSAAHCTSGDPMSGGCTPCEMQHWSRSRWNGTWAFWLTPSWSFVRRLLRRCQRRRRSWLSFAGPSSLSTAPPYHYSSRVWCAHSSTTATWLGDHSTGLIRSWWRGSSGEPSDWSTRSVASRILRGSACWVCRPFTTADDGETWSPYSRCCTQGSISILLCSSRRQRRQQQEDIPGRWTILRPSHGSDGMHSQSGWSTTGTLFPATWSPRQRWTSYRPDSTHTGHISSTQSHTRTDVEQHAESSIWWGPKGQVASKSRTL